MDRGSVQSNPLLFGKVALQPLSIHSLVITACLRCVPGCPFSKGRLVGQSGYKHVARMWSGKETKHGSSETTEGHLASLGVGHGEDSWSR